MTRRPNLILCGLLFPLLGWMGFIHLNGHKFSVPVAYSAGEADEPHDTGAREQANGGPVLLPEKRTTLLNRAQMRGYASYQYYCAGCHGTRGGGNGTNAGNLSTRPARHNDASFVANLSDDAYLTGIIKEGGASQGLSPLMPPWGKVLSEEEVSNLIAFIRILPDAEMVMSAEEHQRSSGMGGHQHGAGAADDHHAPGAADHHGGEATDDHHGTEDDALHASGVDDHHDAEADDHHEEGPDDHHGSGVEDHHETEEVDHHEEEPDDHHGTETDEHGAAETGEHHAD